jgi:hypothetical protein
VTTRRPHPIRRRSQRIRRTLALALVGAALAIAGATAAFAGTIHNQASPNWAGWVALAVPRSQRLANHFTTVNGAWVQPAATCVRSHSTFAAFWVGLGGYSLHSKALEQIGSEADCDRQGQLFYYAWYELVPRPPVTIHTVRISPGDSISASVHVSSNNVKVSLTDLTNGKSFTKKFVMSSPNPDTSAADWITEAPSNCNGANRCRPLLLTDFGQIPFTSSSATSIGYGGRHTGSIDDPQWDHGEIVLSSNGSLTYSPRDQSYALPSLLGLDGSFTVKYGPSGATGVTGVTGASGPIGATGTTGTGA